MLQHLRGDLSDDQVKRATGLLQRNLTGSTDWIVLNVTMDVLSEWARHDAALVGWLAPELERLSHHDRKSVAKRASRLLVGLTKREDVRRPTPRVVATRTSPTDRDPA